MLPECFGLSPKQTAANQQKQQITGCAGRRQVSAPLETQQVLHREESDNPEQNWDNTDPTSAQVEFQELRRNQYGKNSQVMWLRFTCIWKTFRWHD